MKRDGNESGSCLEKHLNVILILKGIFELSSEQLQEYLVKWPDNVGEWINVCGKCGKLIDKYKSIQTELFKVKTKLIRKAKCSFNDKPKKKVTPPPEEEEVSPNVTEQSRQYIKERDCK